MKRYEKKTIIKFTAIYFISTAFFVIILGFLYYKGQYNLILQKHTIKMHQYLIKLKQNNFNYTQKHYSYKMCKSKQKYYELAKKHNNYYQKVFPYNMGKGCIIIYVDASIIDKQLQYIKNIIISIQILLLIIFLIIGYTLAKMSLKPIQDTISHLDRFLKDLIHDLNTPVASIKLNLQLLKKNTDQKIEKPLSRISQSVEQIGSLYNNLEMVLDKTLKKEQIDLYPIFEQKKADIQLLYPNINFILPKKKMQVFTNKASIIRIIDNILSNSCKYSQNNPIIKIDFINNSLIIEDNGKGMKYPQKIFERSYSENENGHGIGMHIVYRLCDELNINIDVNSKQNYGTKVILTFESK